MTQRLMNLIREYQSGSPERARFADRLLEVVAVIDRSFSGVERDRLLTLLEQTFRRYAATGESANRAREILARLEADQARLFQLVDFLSARPQAPQLLH